MHRGERDEHRWETFLPQRFDGIEIYAPDNVETHSVTLSVRRPTLLSAQTDTSMFCPPTMLSIEKRANGPSGSDQIADTIDTHKKKNGTAHGSSRARLPRSP
jgi:hypothetical protein